MSHANSILAAAVALALLGSGPAVAQKKLYCWNENGKKVCGDALPAEASDSARTEISASSGLRTGQVSRALTDAELFAILLHTGTKDLTAVELAQLILQRADNNLHKLSKLGVSDLMEIKGVGPAKAISIVAAMEIGRRRRSAAR